MATGAKACKCGKALRSNNKSGMCGPCWDKSPRAQEVGKRYYEANRDRISERDKAKYRTDPEPAKARARKWYQDNPERAATSRQAWRKANPDLARAHDAAARALQSEQLVEWVYRSVVWERDQGICHLCLQPADPADWHLDHVISLHDGGPHCYANVAVAHPFCNDSKGRNSRSLCGVRWSEATGAYKQFHDKEYE